MNATAQIVVLDSARSVDPTGTSKLRVQWRGMTDIRLRQFRFGLRTLIIDRNALGLGAPSDQLVMFTGHAQRMMAFGAAMSELANNVFLNGWLGNYVGIAWQQGFSRASFELGAAVSMPNLGDADMQIVAANNEFAGIVAAAVQSALRIGNSVHGHNKAKAFLLVVNEFEKIARRRMWQAVDFCTVQTFNRAKIMAYRRNGVLGVGVLPEVKTHGKLHDHVHMVQDAPRNLVGIRTAGDDRVCAQCEDFAADAPYSLNEAERALPLHPHCRCSVYPWHDRRFRRDAAMANTLYVRRNVLNADEIIAWAKSVGFETTLQAHDMHVTVCYSKAAVDWATLSPLQDTLEITADCTLDWFGDDNDVAVLSFTDHALALRHQEFRKVGATWGWPTYTPHVTISWHATEAIAPEPYRGRIVLGPEVFQKIKEKWSASVTEDSDFDPKLHPHASAGSGHGGQFTHTINTRREQYRRLAAKIEARGQTVPTYRNPNIGKLRTIGRINLLKERLGLTPVQVTPAPASVPAPAPEPAPAPPPKPKLGKADFDKANIIIGYGEPLSQNVEKNIVNFWENKIKLSPEDFKHQFLNGLDGSMRLNFDTINETLEISGRLMDKNKSNIASYSRRMNFNTGYAYSALLEINDKTAQSQGVGKTMLAGNVAMYMKLGLKKLGVSANIDVGGYAWARYGYVPTESSWQNLKPIIANRIRLRVADQTGKRQLTNMITSNDPKTLWDIADSKYGKEMLLDTNWAGELKFDDHDAMHRFNAYIAGQSKK